MADIAKCKADIEGSRLLVLSAALQVNTPNLFTVLPECQDRLTE